jgi:hypothetical protein
MKPGSWIARETTVLSVSPRVGLRRRKLLNAFPGDQISTVELLPNFQRDRRVRFAGRRMGIDITWLDDRIAVGGGIWNVEQNMAAVSREGITHIIDMQIECDDTKVATLYGIKVCWNPVDDDFEEKPPEVFEKGVEFALQALEDPKAKLLIHCAAGVHRAPMMTLALLGVMGWAVEDAMDLIEKKRPAADFADVYVRSVEEYLKGRS